jgi:hypothetical protein
LSQPHPLDTETIWLLAEPAVRAYSDLPGLTNDQKNLRADHAWAVITSFGPLNAYGVMLIAHSLTLNVMLGDAARDAILESKHGMLPGQESPMKLRACASYVGLHRALSQNMSAHLRLTKETSPAPARTVAAVRRATENAAAGCPPAVGASAARAQ